MIEHFKRLFMLAESMGTVSSVSLYNNYATITGKMETGHDFTLTLDIREAKENDVV